MCVHFACLYVCVHVHMEVRGQHWLLFFRLCTFFLVLVNQTDVDGQLVPGMHLSHLLLLDYKCALTCRLFKHDF